VIVVRNVPAREDRFGEELTLTVPGQYTLLRYETKSGVIGKGSTVILLRRVEPKASDRLGSVDQRGRGRESRL
jgi:hypothetical protein